MDSARSRNPQAAHRRPTPAAGRSSQVGRTALAALLAGAIYLRKNISYRKTVVLEN